MFITNTVALQEDRCNDSCFAAWIPNYKCMITISGNAEVLHHIRAFFQTLSDVSKENSPPSKAKLTKLSPDKTPTKGKRGFGIVARDLFHSGYTPEAKISNAGGRLGVLTNTNTKSPPERRVLTKASAVSSTQSVFMGLITSAAESNKTHGSTSSNAQQVPAYPLTGIQNSVLDACLRGRNVFYTGGAGTGKSTLLTVLITRLIALHGAKSVFVAATTGLAACAVGGTTVHQFAGISSVLEENGSAAALRVQHERVVSQVSSVLLKAPHSYQPRNFAYSLYPLISQSCSKGYVLKRFREAKVLLVDEVSMLSPTLLEVRPRLVFLSQGWPLTYLITRSLLSADREQHCAACPRQQDAHGRPAGGLLRRLLPASTCVRVSRCRQ
jgi:hypothetical protein